MAIVYCKSCKGKMTQRDTTCPKCGASNSRLIPLLLCIVFSVMSLIAYNAYRQSAGVSDPAIASENVLPAEVVSETEILRVGQSNEE